MSEYQEIGNSNDSDNFAVEQLLEDIVKVVANGKSLFRSNNVSINRSEAMELIDQIREKLPEEITAARWLLKERKFFIEKIQQEKTEIIEDARKRSAELINRVEVVRQAQEKARTIIQDADAEVAQMKSEMERYCEKQLERFEEILAKVYDEVQLGRSKLQSSVEESMTDMQPELNFKKELNFEQHQVVEQVQEQVKIVGEPTNLPTKKSKSLNPELDPLLG